MNSCNEWNQALELTEKMLYAARNSQWDDLTELESARRNLIFQRIFSSPEYNPPPNIYPLMQKLQSLDQQIISLCYEGQQILANQIKFLQLGKRANQAYNS